MQKTKKAGLPSLNEQRIVRKRQLTTGRVAVGGLPPKVFLWGLAVLVVGGFLYFRNAQAELEEQRQQVMNKQRATAEALGPRLLPLRDRVEQGIAELAKDAPDFVDRSTKWEEVFSSPSVYLRLLKSDASSAKVLRKSASASLRDGFTSCVFSDATAKSPAIGTECKDSVDCEAGELCNQFGHCQRPPSPFNMRMVYRALSVLSDEWVSEVETAGTDYALTAYDRGLDSITRVDIPMAIDIYQRSKYVVIVLDEEPKGGLPKEIKGAFESDPERVQRAAHHARVGVWDVKDGKLLARIRAEAAGELRDVGTRAAPSGAGSLAARARQANSCALALQFRDFVVSDTAASGESEVSGQSEVADDSEPSDASAEKEAAAP